MAAHHRDRDPSACSDLERCRVRLPVQRVDARVAAVGDDAPQHAADHAAGENHGGADRDAVVAARKAQPGWAAVPIKKRLAVLAKFRELLIAVAESAAIRVVLRAVASASPGYKAQVFI